MLAVPPCPVRLGRRPILAQSKLPPPPRDHVPKRRVGPVGRSRCGWSGSGPGWRGRGARVARTPDTFTTTTGYGVDGRILGRVDAVWIGLACSAMATEQRVRKRADNA